MFSMSVLFHGPYRLDILVNGTASNEALRYIVSFAVSTRSTSMSSSLGTKVAW